MSIKNIINKFAPVLASFLSLALVVCANTSSTLVVHQPEAPKGLDRFSKVR